MPTYEYECDACRSRFERRQRMTDEPVKTCPECGGSVRRLLFPVGIVFKGSGFYVTDNRRNGSSTLGSSEAGSDESKNGEKKVEKVEAATSSAEAKTGDKKSSDSTATKTKE